MPVLHQAAPVLPLAPARVVVLANRVVAGHRRLSLRLLPGRSEVSMFTLRIGQAARLLSLRVADELTPAASLHPVAGEVSLNFLAPRAAGEDITIELASPGPLPVVVTTRTRGLPPSLAPALPATVVPAPDYSSFTTQVRQELQL